VRITQQELGNLVGMSREGTNKQLRAWEEREWVQLARGSIAVVDAESLIKLIG
jgi:CRP-like cAMP-binding protein